MANPYPQKSSSWGDVNGSTSSSVSASSSASVRIGVIRMRRSTERQKKSYRVVLRRHQISEVVGSYGAN